MDVNIRAGGSGGFPDPEELARKYAVDMDERGGEGLSKADAESRLLMQIEMAQRQKALMQKLEAKNIEVERLCALLEAVEPVPGMDAAKFKRLLENPDVNENIDFRDSKIVALAKKCRKLQMAVNKERSLNESKDAEVADMRIACDKLRKEVDALSAATTGPSASRTIRAPTLGGNGGAAAAAVSVAELESANHQLRKELSAVHKTTEELRRKLEKSTDEVRSLGQALVREVGDSVSVEKAVDGGWRGRAQQIIMLKSKIKRLEASTVWSSVSGVGGGPMAGGSHTGLGSSRHSRLDVDSQAESGLADMTSERKVAVDAIVEERGRLMEECQRLETKAQGQKARIRKLEEESQTHRQQLKIVLEKSETDDQLILGLRREMQRLKDVSSTNARKESGLMEAKVHAAVRQNSIAASSAAEAEITRLKRLVTQQANQLSTQAEVISELRARR